MNHYYNRPYYWIIAVSVLLMCALLFYKYELAYHECEAEHKRDWAGIAYTFCTFGIALAIIKMLDNSILQKNSSNSSKYKVFLFVCCISFFGFLVLSIYIAQKVSNHLHAEYEKKVAIDGIPLNGIVENYTTKTHSSGRGEYTLGILEFRYEWNRQVYRMCHVINHRQNINYSVGDTLEMSISKSHPTYFVLKNLKH